MSDSNPIFSMIIPVWGKAYIDRMAQFSLPSLLAPSNLPAVCDKFDKIYIATFPEDVDYIENLPAVREIAKYVSVQIQSYAYQARDAYDAMSAFYNAAIIETNHNPQQAYVFGVPDLLWCSHSLAYLVDKIGEGYRAVASPGLRLSLTSAEEELTGALSSHSGEIPARKAIEMFMKWPHPMSTSHYVIDEQLDFPSMMYFPVEGQGIIAQGHHIHPYVCWPRTTKLTIPKFQTLDHDYLLQACELEDIYIPMDSDDFCALELSLQNQHEEAMKNFANKMDVNSYAEWACVWTNEYHRAFSDKQIMLHKDNIDAKQWEKQMEKAQSFSRTINQLCLRNLDSPHWRKKRSARVALSEAKQPTALNHIIQKIKKCRLKLMANYSERYRMKLKNLTQDYPPKPQCKRTLIKFTVDSSAPDASVQTMDG